MTWERKTPPRVYTARHRKYTGRGFTARQRKYTGRGFTLSGQAKIVDFANFTCERKTPPRGFTLSGTLIEMCT